MAILATRRRWLFTRRRAASGSSCSRQRLASMYSSCGSRSGNFRISVRYLESPPSPGEPARPRLLITLAPFRLADFDAPTAPHPPTLTPNRGSGHSGTRIGRNGSFRFRRDCLNSQAPKCRYQGREVCRPCRLEPHGLVGSRGAGSREHKRAGPGEGRWPRRQRPRPRPRFWAAAAGGPGHREGPRSADGPDG